MARVSRVAADEVAKAESKPMPNDERIRVDPRTGTVGIGTPDIQVTEVTSVQGVLAGLGASLDELYERIDVLDKVLVPVLEKVENGVPVADAPEVDDGAAPLVWEVRRMRALVEREIRRVDRLTERVQL